MKTTAINSEDHVWDWCVEVYLQHGIKLSKPKHTDFRKTYQWRYLHSIVQKFNTWEFDDISAQRFIKIAVAESARKGIIRKGLAALHQGDMLTRCYQMLTAEHTDNQNQLKQLESVKLWFDKQTAQIDPFQRLMHRDSPRSMPLIAVWYQASKLSDLFISLSKICNRAVARLQTDTTVAALLPKPTSLYLIRAEFLAETDNLKASQKLFGSDWRRL